MNRHVFTPPSRRTSRGPFIELLDADERAGSGDAPGARSSPARSGLRILPAPERARRAGWVSLIALVGAGIGFTCAGVLYVNRDPAAEPDRTAAIADIEPADPAPAEPMPVLPPPTETELVALEYGAEGVMGDALRVLRHRDVTPAGLRAVAIASRRTTDLELRRRVACYRVRGGAPLDEAFAVLPTTPAGDAQWRQDSAACLVEAIAPRASESPERSLPLLVDRALLDPATPILDGLAQLNLPMLPAAVTDALDGRGTPQARRAAIRIAIALGAAAKWPERVGRWLEDRDRSVRLFAHAELLRQRDDASRRLAARAIAVDPADDELGRRALEQLAQGDGFDRQLAALAADPSQPASARAHAAELVGQHGGATACRLVVSIATAEPALASELAATRRRIEGRFGPRLRIPVRRADVSTTDLDSGGEGPS